MSEYRRVPTDIERSARQSNRRRPSWKLFALVFGFCVIVLGSYRVGQLSVLTGPQETSVHFQDDTTEGSSKNTTDMSQRGKYSVG
jgi:hypothetical protein